MCPFWDPLLRAADQTAPARRAEASTPPSTPDTRPFTPNRTVPNVQRPAGAPSFSENPTDDEFFRARVFAEPLVPTGDTTSAENKALAEALLAFLRRSSNDDVSSITQFFGQFPNSPWRVSLLTDLGILYRRTGHFSKALAAWEEAWKLGKSATQPYPRAITDRAVAELAELNARVGRYERLQPLFAELEGRDLHGPAVQKIEGAKSGLWLMQNRPGDAFRCGPLALDRIRASQNPTAGLAQKIDAARSATNGFSLPQVLALANSLDMNYQMAFRTPGAQVIFPAVAHWKVGHFAALIKEQAGRYLVQDPTFTDDISVTQAALDEEASGYFLIPAGALPQGWRPVREAEGRGIWGKGTTGSSDPNRTKPCDKKDCKTKTTKGHGRTFLPHHARQPQHR